MTRISEINPRLSEPIIIGERCAKGNVIDKFQFARTKMRNWLTLETGEARRAASRARAGGQSVSRTTISDSRRRISDVRRDIGSRPPSPLVARIRPYAPQCAAIPFERRSSIAFRTGREGTPTNSRSAVCALFVRAVCAFCAVCSGALRATCMLHAASTASATSILLMNGLRTRQCNQHHALIKLIARTMCIRIPFKQGHRMPFTRIMLT